LHTKSDSEQNLYQNKTIILFIYNIIINK